MNAENKVREIMKPVARLHITATDTYPDIEVEVMDGTYLQPSMSPVDVYLTARPADGVAVPQLVIAWYDVHRLASDAIIWNALVCKKLGIETPALASLWLGTHQRVPLAWKPLYLAATPATPEPDMRVYEGHYATAGEVEVTEQPAAPATTEQPDTLEKLVRMSEELGLYEPPAAAVPVDAVQGERRYHPDMDGEMYEHPQGDWVRYRAALSSPAPVQAEQDKGTPGPWFVRKLERDGELKDCFVSAPDCQGLLYGAEIMGDDEYRDGIERKLADCELIVLAVNTIRAVRSTWEKKA